MSVMASRPPNMPAGAGGGGPSKRPRLSLQIKTSCLSGSSSSGNAASTSTPNRSRGFPLNPSDPTAFNTLSNAYVTAIERASTPLASPAAAEPLTAITTLQAISLYSPLGGRRPRPAAASAYPATPVSASSPRRQQQLRLLPSNSVMSPTPPVSAGAVEGGVKGRNSTVFSFSPRDAAAGRHSLEQALYAAAAVTIPASPAGTTPASPAATPPKKQQQQQQQQQQPARAGVSGSPPPYTHAKALRSILRNSPLSSRRSASAAATSSPRRLTNPTVRIQQEDAQQQQQQQQQRAAKRVCYHSPIEQEITTNTYTKSHIDLLVEEATASPCSPRRLPVDLLRAFSANEIRDGGQTPGAFEDESKRQSAALSSSGDGEGGVQKSSSSTTRGEKKRRWVWTIGREDEDADEDEEQLGGAVVAAARAAAAAAAAGASGNGGAPLLSVPTPKRKMETDVADVEMAVMT